MSNQKRVDEVVTFKPLELLHMDLMRPMRMESLGGKMYILGSPLCLKQSPRAWHERLATYHLKKGFMRGGKRS
ncbi:hypothetical protein CK203_031233 [Vitis vinifera]|uniref:Retrovirus-related Pol polyprotein from transposon TNT 1-94 n=1 Tax=Vitis vinifera TaxID=29760 RepID=A0A438IXB4_VITVI|nr:hypothetical protein CK203_031233 [Vitis vinifera]